MSRVSMLPSRARAVAGCLVLAAALAATATACGRTATGDPKPAQPESANGEGFEAFVREVGIDMAAVPIAVRREWASAPRLKIDDCAIPGTHAGHAHDPDRGEQAVEHPGTVERRSDR